MKKSKNKIQTDYTITDMYKWYCKKTGNPKNLTQRQYSKICGEYNNRIINAIILDNLEFTFPGRNGCLKIMKYKAKPRLNKQGNLDKRKLAPNWKKTKELWKKEYGDKSPEELKEIKNKPIIYIENDHTDGYRHKWYWDKLTNLVKNHSSYRLDICRAQDRKLAKALKTNSDLNYYEFSSFKT